MTKKILFEGRFIRLIAEDGWEYVQRANCTGIVIMLAKTPKGRVIFVEQFRKPVAKRVIEFPAGLVNDTQGASEETLEEAARRELLEETGYQARRMKHLLSGPVSSGLSTDCLSFFLASGLKKVSEGGGDGTENITVHEVPLARVEMWLAAMRKKGKLVDPKVYAGIYLLRSSR